jgi:hypothetical protein
MTTMLYDKENRLQVHSSGTSVATYLYYTDNMKALEVVNGASRTLIWDGCNYLQGRS